MSYTAVYMRKHRRQTSIIWHFACALLERRKAMSDTRQRGKERVFTVELHSKSDVKNLVVQNGIQRTVIEGTIGALKHADFVEDTVLELVGTRGVLRVDLAREDLAKPPPRLG